MPRIGVLLPSSDTGVELELPELLRRAGVAASLHFARMRLKSVTVAGLEKLQHEAVHQAIRLADAEPDLVLFACTSGTFVLGPGREEQLLSRLASICSAPVVSAAQAMVQALTQRGRRVRLRASYPNDILELERRYLESHGLQVTSVAGLGITRDELTARVSLDELLGLVDGSDEADVIMLSCTNLRLLPLLEVRRNDALPVIGSNSALAEAVAGWAQAAAASGGG